MKETMQRVELFCCTNMSENKGISSVTEYIEYAVKNKAIAVGIVDFNTTQSFITAQEYIQNKNIKNLKLIYGIKTKLKDFKQEIHDIIILVKEQKGLKNLYTLLSNAFLNKTTREIIIEKTELDKYREGLLYGTYGKNGELYKKIFDKINNIDEIAKYYDFIQIEPLYNLTNYTETMLEKMKKHNKKLIELANKNNILVVASSNPIFVNKEDKICNEIFKYSQGLDVSEFENENYMFSTEEMLKEFDYLNENISYEVVVTNTHKLVNLCENINLLLNKSSYPKIEDSTTSLKETVLKKAKEIYGKVLPVKVKERLKIELDYSIIINHFEFIYLLACDLVKKSKEYGYSVTARGSVGNSLVAFLLGITDYNPIDYNLPFEMFAGNRYDKEPDINLNFSNEIKPKIFEYLFEKFGKDKVVFCGTVGTSAEKTVQKWIEKYSKDFDIKIENRNKIENKLVGIKRNLGVHPGGVFILPPNREFTEFCPIDKYEFNEKNIIKTHEDYHKLHSNFHLYKCDVLGSDTLTMLYKLKKFTNIEPEKIALNDKNTLDIFSNSNENITLKGIPGFGTELILEIVEIVKPKNINDLACIYSLVHGTDTWISNAEKLIKTKKIPIDQVVSNRADIMNYLIDKEIPKEKAFEITEFIRKGHASKAIKSNSKEDFIKNQWYEYKKIMIEHNIPEWYIESCEKIKYLFPKAHSIGYTIDAFRIAWYKVHYPEAFYKVYFEVNGTIDLNKYTSKKQVEKRIAKLKLLDKSEVDFKMVDELYDLEILLEKYNRGIY